MPDAEVIRSLSDEELDAFIKIIKISTKQLPYTELFNAEWLAQEYVERAANRNETNRT